VVNVGQEGKTTVYAPGLQPSSVFDWGCKNSKSQGLGVFDWGLGVSIECINLGVSIGGWVYSIGGCKN